MISYRRANALIRHHRRRRVRRLSRRRMLHFQSFRVQSCEVSPDKPRKRSLALGRLLASHLKPPRLEERGEQIVVADEQQDVQAQEAERRRSQGIPLDPATIDAFKHLESTTGIRLQTAPE